MHSGVDVLLQANHRVLVRGRSFRRRSLLHDFRQPLAQLVDVRQHDLLSRHSKNRKMVRKVCQTSVVPSCRSGLATELVPGSRFSRQPLLLDRHELLCIKPCNAFEDTVRFPSGRCSLQSLCFALLPFLPWPMLLHQQIGKQTKIVEVDTGGCLDSNPYQHSYWHPDLAICLQPSSAAMFRVQEINFFVLSN